MAINQIQKFSEHCGFYYSRSLAISNESSKNSPPKDRDLYEASKVVLDALEHHLINIHEIYLTNEFIEFLTSKNTHSYRKELKRCGLYVELSGKEGGSTDNCTLPHQVLLEYTKIRDQHRKEAHTVQMERRRLYVLELIQSGELLKQISFESPQNRLGDYIVTSQHFLKHVRIIVEKFVDQYQSDIGTHSFLAGMRKIIEKQMDEDTNILLWTLNASVISEVNLRRKVTTAKYIDDAVEVLGSFMITSNDVIDSEQGKENKYESFIGIYIHPYISNSFLSSILKSLPAVIELDARANGTIGVFDPKRGSCFQSRCNARGKMDEQLHLLEWGSFLCEVL